MSQGGDRTALAGLHGFARALTSFVGRASQLDEVAALLREYRLVTVTGPGGVGKTRLAAEVARRVAGQFAEGCGSWSWPGCRTPPWCRRRWRRRSACTRLPTSRCWTRW